MTEQLKAEVYVREHRPALMELSFGATVEVDNGAATIRLGHHKIPIDNDNNEWDVSYKVIGHPIQLNDWLAVLRQSIEYSHHYHMYLDGGVAKLIAWKNGADELLFTFNMETGQPATEADFKSFNEIVK